MDLLVIDQIIASSFFLSFVTGYLIDKIPGGVMRYVRKKYEPNTIEYQFMDALNDAMRETCQSYFGEYDETAIIDTFVASIANIKQVNSVFSLEKIFENAIGHPVDRKVLEAWITNFKKEITKPGREWLYRFITSQSVVRDDTIKTDNEQYAKIFEEVMFLHKNTKKVIRLCDLFVLHEFEEIIHYDGSPCPIPKDILDYIKHFITCGSPPAKDEYITDCLFIEGDAGLGKSSLVSYFAHLYCNDFVKWLDIFGERELICVRLRDIMPASMRFSSNSINADILRYMNIDSAEQFTEQHKNAVVVLDGFDELCMVERINENASHYIYELHNLFRDCILIVTTRPQYLRIRGLDIRKFHIILKHFDKIQRKEWVNKYRNVSSDQEEEIALNYIENIENEETIGICDTPMALYMLTAGRINEDAKQNHWVLYNQIFYKELSETEYNSVFPSKSGTYSHGIKKYNEFLYRVGLEIAYEMYKDENKKLYLTEDDILKIVDDMKYPRDDIKEIVGSCYALCSYWKMNTEKGAVEFYHNNIRDFFMCEKIFYEMDKLYKECQGETCFNAALILAEGLYAFFRYSEINTKVIEFLYLRVLYQNKSHTKDNFAKKEQKENYIQELFYAILNGFTNFHKDTTLGDAYISMIHVLTNTIQIYRHAYEPFLEDQNSLIEWMPGGITSPLDIVFNQIVKQVFIKTPLTIDGKIIYTMGKAHFDRIYLEGADLRYAGFSGSSIQSSNLSNTALLCADFTGAVLKGTKFINADLRHASLLSCDLTECDFTDANFVNTILPDGFSSSNSDENLEHLKNLNFDGLKV